MGNDREETQQSLVLETDSDSESDMPQLMEEENVSNRLPEVVEHVEVGIDPNEPIFVQAREKKISSLINQEQIQQQFLSPSGSLACIGCMQCNSWQ